jgi:hypothetical protein
MCNERNMVTSAPGVATAMPASRGAQNTDVSSEASMTVGSVLPASIVEEGTPVAAGGAVLVLVAVAVAVVVDDGAGVIASTVEPSLLTTIMHVPAMHCSSLLQSVCRRHADEHPSVCAAPAETSAKRTAARDTFFIDRTSLPRSREPR